ncbi:MAG: monomethylamine:corrinoid methyltransferase [Bacteroidetes bacterium]|nr:monomethylamine:corrinoid methyltransferase [Bacteroidota bacterium]MCL5025800.1 monomethylamine:corrinoid methyltransferase [Chloroflexota bacterium]
MLSLLDIAERSMKGPKMEVRDWEMGHFKTMNELVKKHDIKWPNDSSFFSRDAQLPDRAFAAALEFLATRGVYCFTTGRLIQFTEAEVKAAIRETPSEVIVGEGRDARYLRKRRLNETEHLNFRPGHHAPFSEEVAPLIVRSFASLPEVDYLEGFNFTQTDGREVYGMPIEAYAARRELAWMREGVRKAGRSGLAIAYYPISTRSPVLIAPMDPDYGIRRTDGLLLSVLPDVKVESDLLTAAIVYEDYGAFKVNGGGSGHIGGFCGGVEGAVIEGLVKPIVGMMVYRDRISYAGVSFALRTLAKTCDIRPERVWASSVVCQALNRHANTVYFGGGGGGDASGPGTETHLWEEATAGIVAPVNGANVSGGRQGRAMMNASQSGLEVLLALECAQAMMRAGSKVDFAEELMRKVAAKLKGRPMEQGIDVRVCYDLPHNRPSPAYQALYDRVKDELASWGLDFG